MDPSRLNPGPGDNRLDHRLTDRTGNPDHETLFEPLVSPLGMTPKSQTSGGGPRIRGLKCPARLWRYSYKGLKCPARLWRYSNKGAQMPRRNYGALKQGAQMPRRDYGATQTRGIEGSGLPFPHSCYEKTIGRDGEVVNHLAAPGPILPFQEHGGSRNAPNYGWDQRTARIRSTGGVDCPWPSSPVY